MKFGPHPVRVRMNRALARALGVSEAAVRKARRQGRLSDPGSDGWDPAAARREWAASTLAHVGGKRRAKGKPAAKDRPRPRMRVSAEAVAAGETQARRLLGTDGADVLSFADAR